MSATGDPTSATPGPYVVRTATEADVPALRALIADSVRALSVGYYSAEQAERALVDVFGPDTQLIADRTYYVVEASGTLVAAGGWSRRRTLYGGDQTKLDVDSLLDPASDPARIRAFFVHPAWARRGLGRVLFETCHAAARHAGFTTMTLVATLPGVPLYTALGFTADEAFDVRMSDGLSLPVVRMTRQV